MPKARLGPIRRGCNRTIYVADVATWNAAVAEAKRRGVSMGSLVAEALRELLNKRTCDGLGHEWDQVK